MIPWERGKGVADGVACFAYVSKLVDSYRLTAILTFDTKGVGHGHLILHYLPAYQNEATRAK